MKVIIAGGRDIHDERLVQEAIKQSLYEISEVVSGCADGVDRLGQLWAIKNHKKITRFPAEWGKFGKSAGPRRNALMADYADALIAVWDGQSKGTKNMIEQMNRLGKKVYVHRTELSRYNLVPV